MKKGLLISAAFGLALTVLQTPNAMGAEDKQESVCEWGYWNSGIAPAAGPIALNVDPNSADTPDYRQYPQPQPLQVEPMPPIPVLVRPLMPAQAPPVISTPTPVVVIVPPPVVTPIAPGVPKPTLPGTTGSSSSPPPMLTMTRPGV